jgi:protein tyrosine/serine phosphatase/predicted nucleotidyltransferase
MRQKQIVNELRPLLGSMDSINAAVLYGSLARQEATVNSDVDIAVIANGKFDHNQLKEVISTHLRPDHSMLVAARNKVVCYFDDLRLKVEFSVHRNLESFARDFTGSQIPVHLVKDAILFDRDGSLVDHLSNFRGNGYEPMTIDELANKFIYEFENASSLHRRSDGYRAFFFYEIALQCVMQLVALAEGNQRFLFLPRHLLSNIKDSALRERLYMLTGSMFMPEFNGKKRRLLDMFYETLERLRFERVDEVKSLLERIYLRDWHWNLRPVNTYNSNIRWGKLIRSSAPSLLNPTNLDEFLTRYDVHTVIDLRAQREVNEKPYGEKTAQSINYVHAPFDPWNQPDWFQASEFQAGEHQEIAYRFFAIACRDSLCLVIRKLMEVPTGRGAVIHCHAGKDRTGIIVSILHLLTGQTREELMIDYLASESDTVPQNLNIVLDIIEHEGGVEQYLLNSGLSLNKIVTLKERLAHE